MKEITGKNGDQVIKKLSISQAENRTWTVTVKPTNEDNFFTVKAFCNGMTDTTGARNFRYGANWNDKTVTFSIPNLLLVFQNLKISGLISEELFVEACNYVESLKGIVRLSDMEKFTEENGNWLIKDFYIIFRPEHDFYMAAIKSSNTIAAATEKVVDFCNFVQYAEGVKGFDFLIVWEQNFVTFEVPKVMPVLQRFQSNNIISQQLFDKLAGYISVGRNERNFVLPQSSSYQSPIHHQNRKIPIATVPTGSEVKLVKLSAT